MVNFESIPDHFPTAEDGYIWKLKYGDGSTSYFAQDWFIREMEDFWGEDEFELRMLYWPVDRSE